MIYAPNSTVTLNAQIPDLGLTDGTTAATTAPSETKEGMSTMTIIWIVIGAVAALFALLFWFSRGSLKG